MKRIRWAFATLALVAVLTAFMTSKKAPVVIKTYQILGEDATYIYLGAEVNPADKGTTYYCTQSLCPIDDPSSPYYNCNCTLTIDTQYILSGNKVLHTQSIYGLLDHNGIFQWY
jgi:hypothetical protein